MVPRRHRRRRADARSSASSAASSTARRARSSVSSWRRRCAWRACSGLFQTRDEFIYVIGRLKPSSTRSSARRASPTSARRSSASTCSSRAQPIRTMDELTAQRLWAWNLDPVWQMVSARWAMKTIVTTDRGALERLDDARARRASSRVPSAALAYQWSTEASYFSELGATVLPACMVVSNAAIDPLPLELKQALTATAAKFMNRFGEVSAHLDHPLVDGLLEKQGLVKVPVSPELRQRVQRRRAQVGAQARREPDGAGDARQRREDARRISRAPRGRQAMSPRSGGRAAPSMRRASSGVALAWLAGIVVVAAASGAARATPSTCCAWRRSRPMAPPGRG